MSKGSTWCKVKMLKLKTAALDAKLGDAKRWKDPSPKRPEPHNKMVAREIAAARKAAKEARRANIQNARPVE